MTVQRPAATLSAADRKAARVTQYLLDSTAAAISTAHYAMPDGYWSQRHWLAQAAVRAVLEGLSRHASHWVHTTDFAVFATWIDQLAEQQADVTADTDVDNWVEPGKVMADLRETHVDEKGDMQE